MVHRPSRDGPAARRVKLLFPLEVEAGDYERSGVEFAALLRQAREEPYASPLLSEIGNSASAMSKLLSTSLLP
jgi:hypothetical protein